MPRSAFPSSIRRRDTKGVLQADVMPTIVGESQALRVARSTRRRRYQVDPARRGTPLLLRSMDWRRTLPVLPRRWATPGRALCGDPYIPARPSLAFFLRVAFGQGQIRSTTSERCASNGRSSALSGTDMPSNDHAAAAGADVRSGFAQHHPRKVHVQVTLAGGWSGARHRRGAGAAGACRCASRSEIKPRCLRWDQEPISAAE